MSRTASCLFVLGMGVALAAACGDDDGGDGGTGGSGASGGSGGAGASGGSAGTAGGAGSGDAGTGGTLGGTGGTGGTGSAGTGGSTAGTGGSSAGTSGAAGSGEQPDGGPDGSVADSGPDSSAAGSAGTAGTAGTAGSGGQDPDSGVNGSCGGFTTGLTTIAPQAGQDVVIARVIFNADNETATVVLRVTTPFTFGDPMQLCWGAEDEECVLADDDVVGERAIGTEFTLEVGSQDFPVNNDDGELIFVNDLPSGGNADAPFAYVNWGEHDSADPDGVGLLPTLEQLAETAGFWTDGDSIALAGTENAFFGIGDTDVDTGFDTCTADQF